MHNLIITRILNRGVVTLSELEARSKERGLSLSDLYAALDIVHRDKRIKQTTKGNEIVYTPTVARVVKDPTPHLSWLRANYPAMDETNNGSGIETDFSYLFLSPDELAEYKAAAKGIWQTRKTKYKKKS